MTEAEVLFLAMAECDRNICGYKEAVAAHPDWSISKARLQRWEERKSWLQLRYLTHDQSPEKQVEYLAPGSVGL